MKSIRVVYVYPSSLSDGDLANRYIGLLDEAERRRHAGYIFDEHRLEYLAGCVVAKKLIAKSLGVNPELIRFRRDRFGRPHIERPVVDTFLSFSISHTRGCAMCAVSLGPNIGVDVEHTDRPTEQLPLSSICLSAAELADLKNHAGPALSRRFAQYWTLKEAYGKAVGKGLGVPFEQICCRLGENGDPQVVLDAVDEEPLSWFFKTFQISDRHVAAVAINSSVCQSFRLTQWRPEDDIFVDN